MYYALVLGFEGYIVQSIFNISVTDVTPYIRIVMGLAVRPIIKEEQSYAENVNNN